MESDLIPPTDRARREPDSPAAPNGSSPERTVLHGLAHGELNERDAAEFRALKLLVQERLGFRCDGYKDKCLRRRIAVRMRARGVHAFSDYAALLESDATEYRRLLDAVTINVSKFLRNAEVWARLRRQVIPSLFELDVPEVRIWSAGCAAGEEAYTLAILILEHAAATGASAERFRILGTDIDTTTLEAARRAQYGDFAFGETPSDVRERWFEAPNRRRLREEARSLVEFARHDLIADPYPSGQHLILCRNVVIYFERAMQESVFRRFAEAVAPGGFLLLGKVEALFGGTAGLFQPLSNRDRLFRRS